jgi:ADP-dependent NAD(P)H-hydrate dehydratase
VKLDRRALGAHPLPPIIDGGKETKGRILVIAGSREVPGAALLAATAAMRAGAGKLAIVTVGSAAPGIAAQMPEARVSGVAETRTGGFAASAVDAISEAALRADAIVAGPGVRPSAACAEISTALIESEAALALDVAMLKALRPPRKPRRIMPLLLPDQDELASLLDCDGQEIERDPIGCGRRAAERYRALVLVKGATSHVVTPGGEIWTHGSGAPGLGVSGSGDALAGIVGGLLARGAEPLNALLWAVWLHGQAGISLSKKVGPIGYLAREIADEIPALLPR